MRITDFRDKNVYIVGGSSGIGLETAKILAHEGAHIIIFARNEARLEAAHAAIEARKCTDTQRFAWTSMDASDPEAVTQVFNQVATDFGPPDVLINCAGRAIPHYFEDITYEMFDATMKTNLYGIWNVVAAALPHMKERGGYIVNTSSMAGFVGVFGCTDYAASKFAIMGFTEALRSEVQRYNIGVSVLCPPDTDTPGFEEENKTKPPETMAISQSVKLMTAEAVAEVFVKELKRGKPIIIPGYDGKFTYLAKRFVPGIVKFVMDRTIKKVQSR